MLLTCYNDYSRYAENINYSKYVVTIKSYSKGVLMRENNIYQPHLKPGIDFFHGWCSGLFILEVENI